MLIVMIIVCSIFSPVVMTGVVMQEDGEAAIMTLDVCHATASLQANAADMPVVTMNSGVFYETACAGTLLTGHPPRLFLSFDGSLDEPPRFTA